MAKKESTKVDNRKPSANKVKLHKSYKGIIALNRDPAQKLASKHMWLGLLKARGTLPAFN